LANRFPASAERGFLRNALLCQGFGGQGSSSWTEPGGRSTTATGSSRRGGV